MAGRPTADKQRCGAEGSARESNETLDVGKTNVCSRVCLEKRQAREKLCFREASRLAVRF